MKNKKESFENSTLWISEIKHIKEAKDLLSKIGNSNPEEIISEL